MRKDPNTIKNLYALEDHLVKVIKLRESICDADGFTGGCEACPLSSDDAKDRGCHNFMTFVESKFKKINKFISTELNCKSK